MTEACPAGGVAGGESPEATAARLPGMESARRPFAALARDYDAVFSRTSLGERLRRAVWAHLDRAFAPGSRVLDLGCGTGEDALHLASRGVRVVAVDREPAMLSETERKTRALGGLAQLETREADLSSPLLADDVRRGSPDFFDGAYSNFGALNCVPDLNATASQIASLLPRDAPFLACVMGPAVPWEWGWFLAKGDARRAFRRLSGDPVEWRGLAVSYPSVAEFAEAFAGRFSIKSAVAIGALLPPSYVREWIEKRPSLLDWLDRAERRLESLPSLSLFADHYLVWMTRQ